jgi:hypothetical protein
LKKYYIIFIENKKKEKIIMAARGSEAKEFITKKLLETFDGSFLYNNGKEIRIPVTENGENLQIKIALTCAKTNVEQGEDTALPGATKVGAVESNQNILQSATTSTVAEPTEEEKRNVSELIAKLGLAK